MHRYLAERGHLQTPLEPRDVALFLLGHKDRLDKTVIGDYLGKEQQYKGGFCVRVLHAYIDALDFDGLRFEEVREL
jgi:brefeldin A-inhibited guanine nucleotide-exchange protein